jgi:molybdopterin-synthase adenylyltransferase
VSWLNEACVRHNIPFINAGIDTKRAIYYTIVPKESGCVECWVDSVRKNDRHAADLIDENERQGNIAEPPRPAIVHFVSVLTGLIIAEFIKLATAITKPIATNKLLAVDFESMSISEAETWHRTQIVHCVQTGITKSKKNRASPSDGQLA